MTDTKKQDGSDSLHELVLCHVKLDGRFRVKKFPARDSLPECALMEKEYKQGKWREYGIVGMDEFIPENSDLDGSRLPEIKTNRRET